MPFNLTPLAPLLIIAASLSSRQHHHDKTSKHHLRIARFEQIFKPHSAPGHPHGAACNKYCQQRD
ncbi:uncharacterized protein LACBIDRAFT_298648 [Laccaria bicolor S238N-H82]|uniref:Predicted protein n=1 Tax=Laccaria bicolor (strain S238N-H82 / ATCC MYA-4686) TaxID=486041 RepID=B0DDB1_LACBS|nr:uncharacterized protein LACBIDRAFT_298648 [Laccaria bicolor S238N-H82]EDR07583.1 predicted protein [Laccaria bicolor S238N-H82]|eukprot:XP_001881975.1 predicted protein [Laccaria bicolor S238N-H82]